MHRPSRLQRPAAASNQGYRTLTDDSSNNRTPTSFIAAGVVIVLAARWFLRDFVTGDVQFWVAYWYDHLLKEGLSAFQRELPNADGWNQLQGSYPPTYYYLLYLATWFDGLIPKLYLIKLVSIGFDFVAAFFAFKIVFLSSRSRRRVFLDPRWYLAHVVFMAVIAPDIVWNAMNLSEGGYFQASASKALGGTFQIHGKALSLFLGEILMFFEPEALGGTWGYWCWPLRTMHWVAGGLYLGATAWAWRMRSQPGVALLGICFLTVLTVVTFIPGKAMWDPFWWAAMAMTPAIVFAGAFMDRVSKRNAQTLWCLLALLCWLTFWTVRTLAAVPFSAENCRF